MSRLPVRCAVLALGAMVNLAKPPPDPVAPAVTVIQGTLLAAVQLHPDEVVTVADELPPAIGTDAVVGEIEYEHPAAP
jgi:hypothetical protein